MLYTVGMGIFSSLKKKKSERVLLGSIGSATVVGAFISIEAGITTVTATVSTDIAALSDLSLSQFEKEMEKALRQTLGSLAKLHSPAPDRTVVYFSSPWYASQVRIAKMSRPSPFVVTKTVLSDMIARELKAFEDEEIAGSRGGKESLRAIESKVIQVKLNGYPTAEPANLSASELEISIFLSVAQERTLKGVEEIITNEYHSPIVFSSFLSASFIVVRDFFPHESDYLLVEVGGEVTDVTLVRESALIQSASVPLGSNFILRRLSTGLKRSVSESVSLCTLYLEDKVEASIKDACARILTEAKDEWLQSFQKVLFSVSNELSIPDTVLLSVGTDIAPWFIDTIRREKFNQYALTEKEFKVIVLNAEIFHESLSFAPGVPRNPCIIIEALASTRMAEHANSLTPSKK